ncbi:alpha/beta hydrolase [Streptomyces sp. NPDC052109]|uniref:alpha/beta hydrolase n=1 Tax=Streptomyces sp. NPDC052109 TaxID=3155527 RepID=UPI00341B8593
MNGSKVAGALLIGETLDAAMPFEGSLGVRARFPHSAPIGVLGGIGNGKTPGSNTCADASVAAYLTTGTLPTRTPAAMPASVRSVPAAHTGRLNPAQRPGRHRPADRAYPGTWALRHLRLR